MSRSPIGRALLIGCLAVPLTPVLASDDYFVVPLIAKFAARPAPVWTPGAGDVFMSGTTGTLSVTVPDPDPAVTIASVSFFLNGVPISGVPGRQGSVFTLAWTPSADGVFLLKAVATTRYGYSTELYRLVGVGTVPAAEALAIPDTAAIGTTPGTFAVSESGAATYTIPIQVPPGAGGMQPSISFSYNSQAGNGHLGVGWSIGGLSAVHRCPKTLDRDGIKRSLNYDTDGGNDVYCLDGERLVQVDRQVGVPVREGLDGTQNSGTEEPVIHAAIRDAW